MLNLFFPAPLFILQCTTYWSDLITWTHAYLDIYNRQLHCVWVLSRTPLSHKLYILNPFQMFSIHSVIHCFPNIHSAFLLSTFRFSLCQPWSLCTYSLDTYLHNLQLFSIPTPLYPRLPKFTALRTPLLFHPWRFSHLKLGWKIRTYI